MSLKRLVALITLSTGLLGCASQSAPKIVEVPIKMACDVKMPVAPIDCHTPPGKMSMESDAYWLRCELGLAVEYRAYARQLETLVGVCRAGD